MATLATETIPSLVHQTVADFRSTGPARERITSIDAIRGLNIFLMIVVNNLHGNKLVPWWMQHFNPTGNGMTFVDLVFPGFLFIAGMSIPFAIGSRLKKGEPVWETLIHVLLRVLSLLLIGVMMVNGRPDDAKMGWSGRLWQVLMFTAAILAFCSIQPCWKSASEKTRKIFFYATSVVRLLGFAGIIYLAFAYRGAADQRIIRLSPFSINVQWWGILGQIGWCYLTACIVFVLFRGRPTATLGCIALLAILYLADHANTFNHFWLRRYVNIGETFGTHGMLAVAGVLLGGMLLNRDIAGAFARMRFTLLFVAGFSIAALLMYGQFGINKNNATPSWGFWGCAVTGAIWLLLYLIGDVLRLKFLTAPLAIAGRNVLLAYLLSEMCNGTLQVLGFSHWYSHLAVHLNGIIIRGCLTAVAILVMSTVLNLVGFRLKL